MIATPVTEHDAIAAGVARLGVALPPAAIDQLVGYLDLLVKWNRVHNLTAIRERAEMVTLHLLDSLAVAPLLGSGALLDVGTGAGLPGVPLAIARPDLAVTLLDSNQKKIAFLREVVASLALRNVTVVAERVERLQPAARFDMIIARAFADLGDFVRASRALLADHGRLLAMKGQRPDAEIAALPATVRLVDVHPLRVPGLDAARHLLVIEPT